MEDLKSIVGENIKFYRKTRHLSIEQLAFLAGVSTKQLGQIERAVQNSTLEMIDKIANALMIDNTVLFLQDKLDLSQNKIAVQLAEYCSVCVENMDEKQLEGYYETQRGLLKMLK